MRAYTFGIRDLGIKAYDMYVQDESRWHAPISPTMFSKIVRSGIRYTPLEVYRAFVQFAIVKTRYGGYLWKK